MNKIVGSSNALNELRNTVIHDVRNVGFDLRAYVADFDANRLRHEAKRFNSFSEDDNEIDIPGEGKQPLAALFKAIPKRAIWWSAMNTLGVIYENKKMIALRHKSHEDKARALNALVRVVARQHPAHMGSTVEPIVVPPLPSATILTP